MTGGAEQAPLVEAKGLEKRYRLGGGSRRQPLFVHALSGVDLSVAVGETVGVIGESGSGKSTLGRVLLALEPPTAGEVRFDGRSLQALRGEELRRLRRRMAMVFQNPFAAVNRRRRVLSIVSEPLLVHRIGDDEERSARARTALRQAGLPGGLEDRYPSELSGGQLQRVAVARALVLEPDLVVADEPTASLDVSVRAQVINLFADLKVELGLAMVFISHDLGTVSYLADRVVVLYLGRVVEVGPMADLERAPLHPYSQALISAIPSPDPHLRHAPAVRGQIPSAVDLPSGCAYHPRCPFAETRCRTERPELRQVAPGRWAACHLVAPVDASSPSGVRSAASGAGGVA
jgi:oligopeptide/dipeptide ABC transporter ATP-binding protein